VAPGSSDATPVAERILDAFASQRLIRPLSRDDPSLDEDSAYAIALEVYSRRVHRGERPVGRKIGFTNRNLWAEYQVSTPIWGHVEFQPIQGYSAGTICLPMHSRLSAWLGDKRLESTAGVGFEPTGRLHAQRFSRPPRSTAPAPRR
jgi:hypothetical protein